MTMDERHYVNIGGMVMVLLPDGRPPPVMLPGDTLDITWPRMAMPSLDAVMANYPTVVPIDSAEARQWFKEQAEIEAAEAAQARSDEDRAEEWLAAHEVPDYVIEYLRHP